MINIEKKGSHAIDSSQIMHFKNQALYEKVSWVFFPSWTTNMSTKNTEEPRAIID